MHFHVHLCLLCPQRGGDGGGGGDGGETSGDDVVVYDLSLLDLIRFSNPSWQWAVWQTNEKAKNGIENNVKSYGWLFRSPAHNRWAHPPLIVLLALTENYYVNLKYRKKRARALTKRRNERLEW